MSEIAWTYYAALRYGQICTASPERRATLDAEGTHSIVDCTDSEYEGLTPGMRD